MGLGRDALIDPVEQQADRLSPQRHPRQRQHRRQHPVLHHDAGAVATREALDRFRRDIVRVPGTRWTHDEQVGALEGAETVELAHGQVDALLDGVGTLETDVHAQWFHRTAVHTADLIGRGTERDEPPTVARKSAVGDLRTHTSGDVWAVGWIDQGGVRPQPHPTQGIECHLPADRPDGGQRDGRAPGKHAGPDGARTTATRRHGITGGAAPAGDRSRGVCHSPPRHRADTHRHGRVLRPRVPRRIGPALGPDVMGGPHSRHHQPSR